MQLHNITKQFGRIKKSNRLGRGGKRGKTCGHGHKGQKQHGRHGIRPAMRDFIKKLPKLRGHGVNRAKTVNAEKIRPSIVNLADIQNAKLTDVNPQTLLEANLIEKRGGKMAPVKILSANVTELKAKLNITGCGISQQAKDIVEKAGGSVK